MRTQELRDRYLGCTIPWRGAVYSPSRLLRLLGLRFSMTAEAGCAIIAVPISEPLHPGWIRILWRPGIWRGSLGRDLGNLISPARLDILT